MENQNIWYHGTSDFTWKQIQKEGKLLGIQKNGKRFTFLCSSKDEASLYGDIVLRVEYDPLTDLFNNNFSPDTSDLGEMKVSSGIELSKVRRV